MSNEEDKTVKTTPLTVDEINAMMATPMRDPMIGKKLAGGRYEILDALGQGGMSVVYKAKQELVDRIVAIKTLKVKMLAEPMLLKRFEREVKTLSRLNHPNIVTVYDCIVEDGQPYFVMDFLQGCSLQDLISAEKRLTAGRCRNIFGQVCSAVDHAHRNGIVHRDLKPANIMLMDISGQEFVKVVDFGLAKIGEEAQRLTQTGEIWGSPLYMSPEQCNGHSMDARSDIYSIGAVLYEAMTGHVPFMGTSFLDTIQKVVSLPPPAMATTAPDLNIPPEIEAIVMRCLEKDPDRRYQSMAELKDAIDRVFPADPDALFRTLPPGKMVVDKAAAQPTKELKRDPESVAPTKRMKRSEMDEIAAAARPDARSKNVSGGSTSKSSQAQGKKEGSSTMMAGVVGGLIAACAVVVVSLISNQPNQPPAQPVSPAVPAAPTATAPTATAPTAPAPTAAAPTSPPGAVPLNPAPAPTAAAPASPPASSPTAPAPTAAAPASPPASSPNAPAPTAAASSAPSAKTAKKPVRKGPHSKAHQGSPATIYTPRPQSGRELDDQEIWQNLPK